MAENSDIKQLLIKAKTEAKARIDAIYACEPLLFDVLRENLTDYVLARFLLERSECEGVDFQKLSELSLAKSMRISKDLVKEFDIARSCAGASSAMTKKVLLYMALQKDLKIELIAERTPKVHTFDEFAQLVRDSMLKSEFWRARMPG